MHKVEWIDFTLLTSESKKPGQIAVVYHYCDSSRFFLTQTLILIKVYFESMYNVHTYLSSIRQNLQSNIFLKKKISLETIYYPVMG